MDAGTLNNARMAFIEALVLAGVTGDETFGDLLDAADGLIEIEVRAALEHWLLGQPSSQ